MGWATEDLKAVLVEHGPQYFASKGEDRDQLVDTIVSKLDHVKSDLPKPVSLLCRSCIQTQLCLQLHAKIRVWYNNNTTLFHLGGEIKEADKKGKVKRWDAKAVAQDLHRIRYDEIKSEVIAAGAEWNNVHRSTMTRLWDELTDKEQKTCQETASSRNTGDISEKDKRE
jgi:hypothetical protein